MGIAPKELAFWRVNPPPMASEENLGGDLVARRSGLDRFHPALFACAAERREWGTNVLYSGFVPMQMLFLRGVQKGLTTARTTIAANSAAGTSFQIR